MMCTPLLQSAYLALDARAAVDGQDGESVDVLRVVGEVAGNLQAEFAGGRENQRLRLAQRAVDALYHGQAEGSRLTRTGLGQSHQVGPLRSGGGGITCSCTGMGFSYPSSVIAFSISSQIPSS